MKKEYLNWKAVEDFVTQVCIRYSRIHLTGVYALPRGGLVLGVILSHKLGIPLLMAPVENCLIVDDICDSGESLLHYANNSSSVDKPNYHIVTMFYKKGAKVTPEFYSREKENNWIVFPWERRN